MDDVDRVEGKEERVKGGRVQCVSPASRVLP